MLNLTSKYALRTLNYQPSEKTEQELQRNVSRITAKSDQFKSHLFVSVACIARLHSNQLLLVTHTNRLLQKTSSKFVNNCLSYPVNRQTDRQTDGQTLGKI